MMAVLIVPQIRGIKFPFGPVFRGVPYLIGPGLYFYVRAILSRRNTKDWLHFLPYFLWVVVFYVSPEVFPQPVPTNPGGRTLGQTVFGLGNAISLLTYGFYLLWRIKTWRVQMEDAFSQKTPQTTLSWIRYMILGFLLFFGLAIGIIILGQQWILAWNIPIHLLNTSPMALFLFVFLVFAPYQPQLVGQERLPDSDQLHPIPEPTGESTTIMIGDRYQKSGLSPEDEKKLLSSINTFIREKEAFRQADLCLQDIAKGLNRSPHHVSQAINNQSGQNFFALINSYRIEAYVTGVQNGLLEHQTITSLALDCGFNSSSTFYSFFKKRFGKTPKQHHRTMSLQTDHS